MAATREALGGRQTAVWKDRKLQNELLTGRNVSASDNALAAFTQPGMPSTAVVVFGQAHIQSGMPKELAVRGISSISVQDPSRKAETRAARLEKLRDGLDGHDTFVPGRVGLLGSARFKGDSVIDVRKRSTQAV
ncbi:MAG: hypothetical protein ACKVPX_07840 [Myxococcaceae bacterium]